MRSLASVRRARERERQRLHQGEQEQIKVVREVVVPEAITVQERFGRPIMSGFHGLFSIGGLAGAASAALAMSAGAGPAPHLLATAAGLLLPTAAAVLRVQDGSPRTHCPARLGRGKGHGA